MTHKLDKTKRNKPDKHARHQRKKAKRKLMKGLTADSRSGYKRGRK